MGKQRKTWTVEQKLTIILAALRDEQSVAALARQHGVSEQQIYRWKAQFLDGGRQALNGAKRPRADHSGIGDIPASLSSLSDIGLPVRRGEYNRG